MPVLRQDEKSHDEIPKAQPTDGRQRMVDWASRTGKGCGPHLCAYCSENFRIISKLFVSFFSSPVAAGTGEGVWFRHGMDGLGGWGGALVQCRNVMAQQALASERYAMCRIVREQRCQRGRSGCRAAVLAARRGTRGKGVLGLGPHHQLGQKRSGAHGDTGPQQLIASASVLRNDLRSLAWLQAFVDSEHA